METKCLECGKPVPQTEGKRAKSYCDNTCRVTYWKKQKRVASGVPTRSPGRPKKSPFPVIVTKEAKKKKEAPVAPKIATKPQTEPVEGTNAYFLRFGAFYKKDIKKQD